MVSYFLRRLLINIPLLILVTMVVYLLAELAPGDPVDFFVNPELGMSPEQELILRERLGLNAPIHVRYLRWIEQVFQGNLGYRFVNGESISALIAKRLGNTLILVSVALVFGSLVGVALGTLAALKQYSFWDLFLTGVSFIGISVPAFIAGILGLYIFAVKLRVFPAGGMYSVGGDRTLLDLLHHLILPAGILSLAYIASYMRYTRFSMLEVVRQDFVQVARAKGLFERVVITRHIMRNAILPVVTIFGLNIPNLFIGAVFMETIFSWPGMGTLYLEGVSARDYPLIMGINLIFAIAILSANMLTDFLYAVVDPRIRYD